MEKEKILFCVKCEHEWKQRGKKKPKQCPSCHSPNWNKRNNKDLVELIVGDCF
jgi:rubrerythrin